MKRHISLLAGIVLCAFNLTAQAQKATLLIEVKKPTHPEIGVFVLGTNEFLPSRQPTSFPLDNDRVKLDFNLSEITSFRIMGQSNAYWSYGINLSPGDSLHVLVDNISGKDSILISGTGVENNQPFMYFLHRDAEAFSTDSLPDNFLSFLQKEVQLMQAETATYINKYHPTAAFQAVLQQNIKYAPALWFTAFYGNHKFYLRRLPNSESLLSIWDNTKDSILAAINLNNDEALASPFYKSLLSSYILRRKEQLWSEVRDSTNLALYYADYPASQRMQIFESDQENLFVERIINKEFTGAVNEFLYAHLLTNIRASKKTNASAIFDRFSAKYPNSKYLATFQPMIDEARKNESRALNEKMVFVDSTEKLTSFDEVLAMFKGKTVLVDMWGTWCGPCHEEMEKHSGALKAHFKDKDLAFLYVSNYDQNRQATWKKLISYYNLEGSHILANPVLTEDIAKKSKLSGYPTYLIIKKDGSYELSNAGYPMDREKLIQQIESLL